MNGKIEIEFNHTTIGCFRFVTDGTNLRANRIGAGFQIHFPFVLELFGEMDSKRRPQVGTLKGDLFAVGIGEPVLVGQLVDEQSYLGPTGTGYTMQGSFSWTGSLGDLAVFEKIRDGGEARFNITLRGESRFVLRETNDDMLGWRSAESKLGGHLTTQIRFAKEQWVAVLRALKVTNSLLVEIAIPFTPRPGWEDVFAYLSEARNSFLQGGESGWKGCVVAVREGLKKWDEIERVDVARLGENSTARQNRTKDERVDFLRNHLHQLANFGPHSRAEIWTREDALLVLATMASLLSQRNP
jgi:hypothetical protein